VWHDVAVVATPELPGAIDPASHVARQGALLLASPVSAERLWGELPKPWRASIRERELRVFVLDAPVSELIEWVPWLLGAEEKPEGALQRLDYGERKADEETSENAPPLAVRRFSQVRSSYDNLPRFWGELALPRIQRGVADASPDPYLTLAAVPPSTSSLFEVAVHKNRIPQIDIEHCVGCGACWTACPDSAIVPGVIGTEALLNAAAEVAAVPGADRNPVADKLKRAHRQLAARVDGVLAKQKAKKLDGALLSESFDWLLEQMKVSAEEKPEYQKVFGATLAQIEKLPYAVTEPFFHRPYSEQKGSGELLALSVSPAACQGCGGCSAVCPEAAIAVGERTPSAVADASAGFGVWEQLPDPTGESISRAGRSEAVGNMPAVMTSRHTLLAVTGGGGHEPGSGARVGARLVAAVAELEQQRRTVGVVTGLQDLVKRSRDALRAALAGALPGDDLVALESALDATPDHSGNVGTLVAKLEALGTKSTVDGEAARRLVKLTQGVQALHSALTSGPDGMGRARFGLVVAGEPLGEWAAEFPRNPFAVPTVVDLSSEALDLALGLSESLLERHAADVRLQRLAELWLSAPSDAVLKERDIDRLGWQDLSAEELAACPPVIVLAGPEIFGAASQAGLTRVLASRLPIKVVVLDGRERLIGATDPVLRRAFVLSSTVAHREHLFHGMTGALLHAGPALVHLYAPSPNRHGFDSADTIARARSAVDCRIHPLFVWDPAAEGVFGTHFRLEGNPAPREPWAFDSDGAAYTPARFALGETRFASHFVPHDGATSPVEDWALASPEERAKAAPVVRRGDVECVLSRDLAEAMLERLSTWRTLQELAGVVTPFTTAVRAEADADVAATHQQEIEKVRAEYEAKLDALRASQLQDATTRLGERLVQLAGYAPRGGDGQA
jgi:pyruvate-ferredoxin/flavodoxin oxidoreductase